MAYDLAEPTSERVAGHHAPLFTHPGDPRNNSGATMVNHYLAAGVPPAKLVLGIPFYGHAWAEVPAGNHGLHQPGKNPQPEIEASFRNLAAHLENQAGFQRYWDDLAKAPFLYNQDRRIFISYEDEVSAGLKSRYVMDKELGGIMFWEYWEDAGGRLLDAVNRGLGR
jgi:chitinase